MGLSPAYSYLLSLLLTFFFLEPFFSTQSNIFELNFSSCKSPSVHFSSCTGWKIVKLVTSTGHISCFSFLFLLSSSYFSSRHTCTARVCLCQWLYNIWSKWWSKYRLHMYFSSCSGFEIRECGCHVTASHASITAENYRKKQGRRHFSSIVFIGFVSTLDARGVFFFFYVYQTVSTVYFITGVSSADLWSRGRFSKDPYHWLELDQTWGLGTQSRHD